MTTTSYGQVYVRCYTCDALHMNPDTERCFECGADHQDAFQEAMREEMFRDDSAWAISEQLIERSKA